MFPQLIEFLEANRAIAPSLVLEFTQSFLRAAGPIENEALAALAERGFRFSLDNVHRPAASSRASLPTRGFRFVKVPASLLLDRAGDAAADIHPADLSDLLGRFGIDLIAEKIESEGMVVDLLDYDVRFGQGFLFSPPRPVRAEALQGIADRSDVVVRESRRGPRRRRAASGGCAGGRRRAGNRQRTTGWPARPRPRLMPAGDRLRPLDQSRGLETRSCTAPKAAAGPGLLPASTVRNRPCPPLRFTQPFRAARAPATMSLLCDVWGVVHNGVAATPQACDALARFRGQGGTVVLITNAPRPGEVVQRFLDRLEVPRAAYDGIVSSGDVTRALMRARAGRARLPHRSGARPADVRGPRRPRSPHRAAPTTWSAPACSTTPSRRRRTTIDLIAAMRARDLTMVCANPDMVVERGEQLVYCAGAIADRYAARRRRGDLCRQALPADLRAGAGGCAQRLRGQAGRASTACWRSGIRCAPISRARPRSGSIACS